MKFNASLIVGFTLLLAASACGGEDEAPAGEVCFIALPLLCDGHVAAKHTSVDDPLLALCLPHLTDATWDWYAEGSSVTTFHYGDDNQLEGFTSQCAREGRKQTVEFSTERDEEGRVFRWTTPLEEAEVDAFSAQILNLYPSRTARYDDGGLLVEEVADDPEGAERSTRTVTYDRGRVASVVYDYTRVSGLPSGARTASLEYGSGDKLLAVHTQSEDLPSEEMYAYDPENHVSVRSVSAPELEVQTAFDWDGDKLLESTTSGPPGYELHFEFVWENGQIIEVERFTGTWGGANEWWEYDEHGRPSRLAWWGHELSDANQTDDNPEPEHR